MTRLDQAFIKVYAQQVGATVAPVEGGGPGSGADVRGGPPAGQATDAPAEVPARDVLELRREAPIGIGESLRAEGTPPEPEDAGAEGEPESTPLPEEPGPGGIAHRVDQGTPAASTVSQPDRPAVPPPHIRLPAAGVQDEGAAGAERGGQPFRPMLQVDRFTWPPVCRRLEEVAEDELDRLADGLADAMGSGRKVVAIAGCRRGEGATTLLLCAGRRLAQRDLRVVMADADLTDPQVARRLEVLPETGWEEVLSGRLPLEEVVIESAGDRLAVLPVREAFCGTGEPTKDEQRLADSIETLAAHYDLVLLDLGPLEDPAVVSGWLARGVGSRLDAIVLVHNARLTPREDLAEIIRALATTEIAPAGVIENFVRA